ncbi:unnamed protein product, partial [Choristocarpus tenellus]
DIQEDDYSLKRTLKVKHTTPNGVGVTTKNEHKDGVVGTIEAKYAHKPSGVSIDKLTVREERGRSQSKWKGEEEEGRNL